MVTSWSGRTLAHYQVLDKIGEGGMGEVFRARDATLDRDVAIKVLPAAFDADPERIARFEREAKVLASLNHSGIAAIYGFHEHAGVRFLAMELVPGPDLSQRLAQGPIPVDEAIPLAARIAEALEYAHERNIVHRDLKPANIKLAPGGVKVLDFGLAKAFSPEGAGGGPTATPTILPTVTTGGTQAGVILGTAAYMSPEQARGQVVDRRTDIWAFGCILYECLTGSLLFAGSTVSDTIAAVLRADLDLAALPASTPESVRHLLERCLDRDPSTRLRDIGEARVVLADPRGTTAIRIAAGGGPPAARARRRAWLVAAIAAGGLGLGFLGGRTVRAPAPPAAGPAFLFDIQDSTNALATGSLAISPDGVHLVFARHAPDGLLELLVRRLDREGAQPLPGTRGGRYPFWSADGRDIGFFAGNALLRVSLDGGAASQIATLPDRPMGGTWNAAGVILVGTNSGPIYRVTAAGGVPEAVTTVEAGVEDAHVWPTFFPDGEHYVFLADASSDEGHRMTVRSVGGKESKVLRTGVRSAILVDPGGALLLIDNRQLFALPFDFGRREFAGAQVLVEDDLQASGLRHELPIAVSASGVMAFQRGTDEAVIMRISLDGSAPQALTPPDRYRNPRLFRDGKRIAYEVQVTAGERTIWAQDLDRGSRTLISNRGVTSDSPVWSADGEWIYFGSSTGDHWTVFRKRVLGGLPPEELGSPPGGKDLAVIDCSPDGRWILVAADVTGQGFGLFLAALGGASLTWTPWLTTPAIEEFSRFSPDSRWIAFQSDATGQDEIYVAPVEGGPAVRQWMVSVNGGSDPAWSPDGTRLYYRNPTGTLMAVPIEIVAGQIETRPPQRLFELHPPEVGYLRNVYDPTPDGKAIVAFVETEAASPAIWIRTGWRKW
jgi:hypothetical protein